VLFNKNTKPLLLDYAKNKIELETKLLIVDTVNTRFNGKDFDYKDFTNTVSNNKDEIISIDYDTLKLEDLLNGITLDLINSLKTIEDESFSNNNMVYYIPFGAIINMGSSSWIGPQIPIKIMTSGNVETRFLTNIKEYGINNLILETYIDVNINTNILLPYTSGKVKVNYKVPLVKKIIEGKIPSVYGGLYSTSSNIVSDLIE
jgi:sporulation protein YunB